MREGRGGAAEEEASVGGGADGSSQSKSAEGLWLVLWNRQAQATLSPVAKATPVLKLGVSPPPRHPPAGEGASGNNLDTRKATIGGMTVLGFCFWWRHQARR